MTTATHIQNHTQAAGLPGRRQSLGDFAPSVKPFARESGRGLAQSRPLPGISSRLLYWFTWYSRRYVRRHFHSLRVSLAGLPPENHGLPLVIYSNHASWWDALVCLVLKDEFFGERAGFAPIDSRMLER